MTDRDLRLKKLRLRAWRRGFREADFIFGTFADQHLTELDAQGLDEFEALLNLPDQDVYAWLTGVAPTPAVYDTATFRHLKSFKYFASTLWTRGAGAP